MSRVCELSRRVSNYSSQSGGAEQVEQEIHALTQALCRQHDLYAANALNVYSQEDGDATQDLLALISVGIDEKVTSV